eukprot:Colp12_sorted_trinity150504_noHs@16783
MCIDLVSTHSVEFQKIMASSPISDSMDITKSAELASTITPTSHEVAIKRLEDILQRITKEDPLLSDVPPPTTDHALDELQALIDLEYGSALTVNVRRFTGELLPVIVKQTANVGDLKRAIARKVSILEEGKLGSRRISWKHVWKNYILVYNNTKLLDDSQSLYEMGVRARSEVSFAKRVYPKKMKRPRNQQRMHAQQ